MRTLFTLTYLAFLIGQVSYSQDKANWLISRGYRPFIYRQRPTVVISISLKEAVDQGTCCTGLLSWVLVPLL